MSSEVIGVNGNGSRFRRERKADSPIRVALIQHRSARDVRSWSGTIHFAKAAIDRYVGPVMDLTPAPVSLFPFRVARQLIHRTTGKWYSYEHDPVLARWFGQVFTHRVEQCKPDLIFAPAASACLAHLRTDVPIVYFSDATFRVMKDYNAGLTNVIARTARGGEEMERRAIQTAALALFSSEWASDSAVNDYGARPEKVATVYIGANMPSPPAKEDVLPRRLVDRLRLLMVAVSWEGKGGAIALSTLEKLLEMGVDAELLVVGCAPPKGVSHPRLEVIPFLDKSNPEQQSRFDELWKRSDLLLLPTRYEAAGVVFCEAGAYGLPIVTTRTGGTPALVVDGVNGFALPPEAEADEYARVIARIVRNPDEYERLADGSRAEFDTRLSWDAWGKRVATLIEERIPGFIGRTRLSRPNERQDAAGPV